MLQAVRSVHVDAATLVTREYNRRLRALNAESNNSLGHVLHLLGLRILVELRDDRVQRIHLEVPNLNATIVSDRGEASRSNRRPADIIDLALKRMIARDLMAH